MDFLNNNFIFYLAIIALFLGFFIWNRNRTRKNRESRKNRNFRKRYEERKREKEEKDDDDDTKGPSRTPFPPD